MLTEAQVQREIETGLSAVCAWCLHYWEAKGRAKGTPFACGVGGCGGPSQGRAFPRYTGPRPNKAAHCFICLEEHEKIWTADGYKQIGDVVVGDQILQLNGRMSEVAEKDRREGALLGIQLKSFRHDPLRVTPEHVCTIVRQDDAFKYLPFLTLETRRSRHCFNGRLYGRPRSARYKDKVRISEVKASDVRTGDYFLYPVIGDQDRMVTSLSAPHIIYESVKGPKGGHVHELPVSERLAYLYGLYIAEGSTGRGFVKWTYNINEKDTLAADTVSILMDEFGFRTTMTMYEDRSVCEITCSKTDLAKQLEYWFGKGAASKKVPAQAFFWPANIQDRMIQGWLDGDAGKTISQDLAYGMFGLFVQAGRLPSLGREDAHVDDKGVSHRESWFVYGCKRQYSKIFYEPIGGVNYLWLAVKSVSTLCEGGHGVVDIRTRGDNTFVTKMGAVHNCGTAADMAVEFHRAAGGMIGCCKSHESALKLMLSRTGKPVVVNERLVPVMQTKAEVDA